MNITSFVITATSSLSAYALTGFPVAALLAGIGAYSVANNLFYNKKKQQALNSMAKKYPYILEFNNPHRIQKCSQNKLVKPILFKPRTGVNNQGERREIKETQKVKDLLKKYPVQVFEESGISILVHVVEHFSYHVGQITYYVKWRKNIDTNYYPEELG